MNLKYYHLSIDIEEVSRDEAIKSLKSLIDEIESGSGPEHYIIGHCDTQECDPPIPYVYLSGQYKVYPKDCENDYIRSILKSEIKNEVV